MVNTKFLVIGDPHFKTSNVPESEDFITKCVDLVNTEHPDFIIILGDILHEHERLHTIPLNIAYDFIKAMSSLTKTYVIVGNHDMINNQQFLNQNHWMNSMKEWPNTTIVDVPTTLHHNDKTYMFCPYVPNGRLREALSLYQTTDESDESSEHLSWTYATIIFAHQEFLNCKMGAIISQDGDHWDKSLPPVISGHIHHNQTLLDGHIYYPGSAMQNAFGDPNNILAIIDVPTTEDCESTSESNLLPYNLREIDLMLRKKRIVYHDLDAIDTIDVDKLLNSKDAIKLSLSGNYEDFKIFTKTHISKQLANNGIVIVHKNKKQIKNETISNDHQCPDIDQHQDEDSFDLNPIIADSDDTIENLVHNFVTKEQNSHLVSDFNYIFLGYDKDQEILIV
jgi:DNA repair exonuclease SbcCD nuclease subunit